MEKNENPLQKLIASNMPAADSGNSLYYANYSKEKYNILTLSQHNGYYQQFQKKIPVYVREQPDWSKSAYKQKKSKMNKYNYILYRNAKNVKKPGNSSVIERSSLYRSSDRGHRITNSYTADKQPPEKGESLPLIHSRKGQSKAVSKVSELSKRSLSSYCRSGTRKKTMTHITGASQAPSEQEKHLRRAEQLSKFIQSLGPQGKVLAEKYAENMFDKLDVPDFTKGQMKLEVSNLPETIEKKVQDALKIEEGKSEVNPEEKVEEEKSENEKKEDAQVEELEAKIIELISKLSEMKKK